MELNGKQAVSEYGDEASEERSLTESAGRYDLSFRSRFCLTGADRVRFLHGQVTNDIKSLRLGLAQVVYGRLGNRERPNANPSKRLCFWAKRTLTRFRARLDQRCFVSGWKNTYVADDVQLVDVSHAVWPVKHNHRSESSAIAAGLGLVPELPSAPFHFSHRDGYAFRGIVI
jgi:hypothetical protein